MQNKEAQDHTPGLQTTYSGSQEPSFDLKSPNESQRLKSQIRQKLPKRAARRLFSAWAWN